jgi:hypothetical protein
MRTRLKSIGGSILAYVRSVMRRKQPMRGKFGELKLRLPILLTKYAIVANPCSSAFESLLEGLCLMVST